MKRLILLFLIISAFFSSYNYAQVPGPVDLNIQNIPQDTNVCCWAAVAHQIILRLQGPASTPPQCALVATAFNQSPQFCCQYPTPCSTTGSLQQIQQLIGYFGGAWSSIALPTNAMTVYQTLATGRAIIMAVQSTPFLGHVVVIRGMEWIQTPMGVQPVLYINDPLAYFTQPVPFQNIAKYWQAAIVVY